MFCRLTYSCIQFIQRMVPPLSINNKNKPNWLSSLYKKSRQLSTILLTISVCRVACLRIIILTIINFWRPTYRHKNNKCWGQQTKV